MTNEEIETINDSLNTKANKLADEMLADASNISLGNARTLVRVAFKAGYLLKSEQLLSGLTEDKAEGDLKAQGIY